MVECGIREILSSFRGFRRQFFFKPNPMLIRKMKSALEMLEEMIHPKGLYFCKYAQGGCRHLYNNEKDCMECVVELSEEIVQEVAAEYNGGWIACSERLPEIDGNTSDIVLVCGSNGFQYMAFWCDDLKWRFCECGMAKEPVLWTEIVAWQPLPEPFKERD